MKTSKDKGLLILSTFVCLLPIALYLIVFDLLPEQMIQQWGADGTANWTMPREWAIFVMPLSLALVHIIVFFAINSSSSINSTPPKMRTLFSWFVPVTSVFTNLLILFANLDESFDVGVAALIFVGLTFIITGNYLPKTRQNYFIGVRVPWTMRCADNWAKTHRLSGKLFVATGIVLVLGSVFLTSESALIVTLLSTITLAVVIPITYSFALSRKG